MTPQWILAIALALTTAANTITSALRSCENIANTCESYTGAWKERSLNELSQATLDDITLDEKE